MSILNNFRCAQGSSIRTATAIEGCLKGTHEPILDEIELRTRDFNKSPVYWLNGLAGKGKNSIAQTIVKRMFSDGQLGASSPRETSRIGETSSLYSLPSPSSLHAGTPSFDQSLSCWCADISTVIVIDALGECKDEKLQRQGTCLDDIVRPPVERVGGIYLKGIM